MLHVLLKHPYSNSLSNGLLRLKTVSCKNIRRPETKCILVYDEKMPCHQLETLPTHHLKCTGRKDCNEEIHVMRLGVRNFAAYVHSHLLLDDSRSFLMLYIFMIASVLCIQTHMKIHCRGLNYSMLIDTFQNISLFFPRTQVTFFLP